MSSTEFFRHVHPLVRVASRYQRQFVLFLLFPRVTLWNADSNLCHDTGNTDPEWEWETSERISGACQPHDIHPKIK